MVPYTSLTNCGKGNFKREGERPMHKLRWIFLVVTSYVLASIGSCLYISFETREWTLWLLGVATPNDTIIMVLSVTCVIGIILYTAQLIHEGTQKSTTISLSIVTGTVSYTLVFATALAIFQLDLPPGEKIFQEILWGQVLTKPSIIMSIFVAMSATAMGLAFGSTFVGNGPQKEKRSRIKVISAIIDWIPSLRNRQGQKPDDQRRGSITPIT